MHFRFLYFLLSAMLVLTCASISRAQSDASTRNGRPDLSREDLPTGIQETLAKARLKSEEKEHYEMLERAAQAAEIGAELNLIFEKNRTLSSADWKKVEGLEKLVKKIRRDLGGKDDNETAEEFQVTNLENAFADVRDNSLKLSEELKKASRYSISVKAVENSNALLILLRFIKSNSRSL